MTSELLLSNLLNYSLQLLLLVGAGALLARMLPLRPPMAALSFWRGLLVVCLLLPFAQPWVPAPAARRVEAVAALSPAVAPPPAVAAPAARLEPPAELVLGVLGAGMAARAGWLAIGLVGLARLRRRAERLPPGSLELLRAVELAGARAEFYVSGDTSVPVTFGFRRPAVLLPRGVLEMEPRARLAILCHELIHVRRGDWPSVVVEQGVGAMLWFHPAVAWLVGRIHLSREQAVDKAVVELTDSREEYVGALLEVARRSARPEPVAAALFLRRGRLRQRVAEILKEGTMTRRRLFTHLVAGLVATFAAAGAGAWLFPLEAAEAQRQGPVEVVRGGESVLHRGPVEYPRRAREKRIEGDVLVEVVLDEDGAVQDARVSSGPEELRAAALQSVLRWHFAEPRPGSSQVTIRFRLPSEAELADADRAKRDLFGSGRQGDMQRTQRQLRELEEALQDQKLAAGQREKYAHQLAERRARLSQLENEVGRRIVTVRLEGAARTQRQIEELERALKDQGLAAEQREKYAHQLAERRADLAGLGMQVELEQKAREHALERLSRSEIEVQELTQKLGAAAEDEWRVQRKLVELQQQARGPLEGPLAAIHMAGLPEHARKLLLSQLGVAVGDGIDEATAKRVHQAVRRFDEHLRVEFSRNEQGGIVLLIAGPEDGR
jgi:TonB family protein